MIWHGVPAGFDEHGRPISYNAQDDGSGNAPTTVLGPPGSGKTVLLCNELLDEPGLRTLILTDFKGQIYRTTAAYRRRVSDVRAICPIPMPGIVSDQWNPLNDLNPDDLTSFGDESQGKAHAVIKTAPNEHNPFFPDAARSAVTGAIMDEVIRSDAENRPRSLFAVRALFSLEAERLRPFILEMIETQNPDIAPRVAKFLSDQREIEAIKSTIETQMSWITEPMRNDMLTKGGVDFRDARKHPMTIYIILPVSELKSKAPWLRLLFSTALRAIYGQGVAQ
jgi:type IV secretory pathway TraG/TraD family ATPase VirD4